MRKRYLKNHRRMWIWLAEQYKSGSCKNICSMKMDYLRRFDNLNIYNHCYLCEYVKCYKEETCSDCPVQWPGGACSFYSQNNGLYVDAFALSKLLETESKEPFDARKELVALCYQIAYLPTRKQNRKEKKEES